MRFHSVACIPLVLVVACGGGGSPTTPEPGTAFAAPVHDAPAADEQLDTLRPTLTVRNVSTGGTGARTYEFQVSDTSAFTAATTSHVAGFAATVGVTGVAEDPDGTTSWTAASDLQPATRFYWRARVVQGGTAGAWSGPGTFRTRLVGFNRAGELFDPLFHGDTIGTRSGSTTFLERGLQVNNPRSWVRYQLASTLRTGEISVEVEGLRPNSAGQKSRIFSMMDDAQTLFQSPYLFNVQYRGESGNPDNAISYKVLMGGEAYKYEPTRSQREAGIRSLKPATTYLWTARWGSTFRLVIREGGATGTVIYDRSEPTPGTYNPSPHRVYLGANDADYESGSYAGAVYRNLWVGSGPRPATLGSALTPR